MRRWLFVVLLAAAAPAVAQSSLKPTATPDGTQPRQRAVTVFGTDPCPKATSPDEIVVCSRRPDEERYRIPPAVRGAQGKAGGLFDTRRGALVGNASGGAGGSIGSCSPVGPGGGTGCAQAAQDRYRAEKKAARAPQP